MEEIGLQGKSYIYIKTNTKIKIYLLTNKYNLNENSISKHGYLFFGNLFTYWPNYSSKLMDRFPRGFCKIVLVFQRRFIAPRKCDSK